MFLSATNFNADIGAWKSVRVVEFSELIFIYILIKLLAKARVEDICLGSQLLVGTRYFRGGARDEL